MMAGIFALRVPCVERCKLTVLAASLKLPIIPALHHSIECSLYIIKYGPCSKMEHGSRNLEHSKNDPISHNDPKTIL